VSYSREKQSDFTALLQGALPRFRIDPNSVPAFFQEQVRKRLQEFVTLYAVELQAMFHRARSYLPMIKRMFQQQNVPISFAFLPLVESAFQYRAEHPKSGARGLWQLLPDTARGYGLQVSPYHDDRLHPTRSTQAAARYLRELHDIFGTDSPLLILAAYNFGEQNLAKAIVRARTRDIWALYRKGQLPLQTQDFLVKMVTFWVLIAHADHFQFARVSLESPPASEVPTVRPAALTTAIQPSLPPRHFWQEDRCPPSLTPAPEYSSRQPLPVPEAELLDSEAFLPLTACCGQLPADNLCWHTVAAGDSLWTIAQRYALDVETLKSLNQLTGAKPIIRPGQRVAICAATLFGFAGENDPQ
jgi:membrane-bound lytic murein transglycosylase D